VEARWFARLDRSVFRSALTGVSHPLEPSSGLDVLGGSFKGAATLGFSGDLTRQLN
jgi:hypothetical protein